MTLSQPESMLMSLAHVATNEQMVTQGVGCHLWLCWYLRAMPPPGPPWAVVINGSRLLPRAICGPMVLPQPGSVWMFMATSTTEGHGGIPGVQAATWHHVGV